MERGFTRNVSNSSTRSRRSTEEVDDEAASERQPLLRSSTDSSAPTHVATRSLVHTGTLYSAMVFMPEMTKQRIGHYWTSEVVLVFVLFLMNITVQLSLTIIVGEYLVSQHQEFKVTLLGESFAHASPWTWLLDHVRESSPDIRKVQDIEIEGMERIPWIGNRSHDKDDDSDCCNGYRCANSGLQCCDRSGATPRNLSRPMRKTPDEDDSVEDNSLFLFRKPKASKKKRKQDDGDSSAESADTKSLCKIIGDKITCGPRSYDFLNLWSGLDTNEDGIWTLEEALADEANIGCHIGTSLEEIFRSNCRAIVHEIQDSNRHLNDRGQSAPIPIQIPLSIEEYEAVPREYFNWWRGVIVICMEADAAMCSEIISRGVFDGAMAAERGWTKGGVKDLDSALRYCERLLEPGGICENSLPGYYQLYRSRVNAMCGKRIYSHGSMYANPSNSRDVMETIHVTYGNVKQIHEYSTVRYRFFLCMTLLVWYICLLEELKDIVQWIDFLFCFYIDDTVPIITPGMKANIGRISHGISKRLARTPEHADGEEAAAQEQASALQAADEENALQGKALTESDSSEGPEPIRSMSRLHWCTVFFLTALRVWLLVYLFDVGTTFLLSNQSYLDLLLNAVALAMIFDLPSTLYSILFSDTTKKELEGVRTVEYDTYLPDGEWSSILLSKFFWGCIILPLMIYWAVAHNHEADIMPIYEALQCTCNQEGPRCTNSEMFTRRWWNGYWAEVNSLLSAGQRHHSVHAS